MKILTVLAHQLKSAKRVDAHYFLSPGVQAAQKIQAVKDAGIVCRRLGGSNGFAKVWAPGRFKRSYAAPGESSVPYLRPYDLFGYLPKAADLLSIKRTKNLDKYKLTPGMILQTCSGRNLGPVVMADKYLSQFVLSHDMLRIEVADSTLRFYLLAFLSSPTGQQLLRRDKTGSVIDHLSVGHLCAIEIPMIAQDVMERAARAMRLSVTLIERARVRLDILHREFEASMPQLQRVAPLRNGWEVRASSLIGRIDAAAYDPFVIAIQDTLKAQNGVLVREIASVRKPAGRYKTCYVDRENGYPILSGGQLLQYKPINLRYMPGKAFKDVEKYKLHSGMIAYPADGRAEEGLGEPVLISDDRDGWLASGHVGRVVPNTSTDPGWLYLALSSHYAQLQLKAKASGSVVDATYEGDMENVVLPTPSKSYPAVRWAWRYFVWARRLEALAVSVIEDELDRLRVQVAS